MTGINKARKRSAGVLMYFFAASLLVTCEKVPDYCGKGNWYNPDCEFCFSQKPYPLCGGAGGLDYNPLTQGCYRGFEVGSLCLDGGKVVPLGTPCNGYELTTRATPENGGRVTRNPSKPSYEAGERVTLRAAADTANGYVFIGWAGSPSKRADTTVTMDKNKPMVAIFRSVDDGNDTTRILVTAAVPSNGGTIIRKPNAEDDIYDAGSAVGVKAVASAGYRFDGWSGSQTSASDSLGVLMNGNKTLVAMFRPNAYTLSAGAVPTDGGAVYVNGTALSQPVTQEFGTSIVALAKPNDGYIFAGWSGAASGTVNPARISVTKDGMEIIATFKQGDAGTPADTSRGTLYPVTILIGGTGASVEGSYAAGETVTISVQSPPPGQRFKNWTTASPGVTFADANSKTTTFTMPANPVTVTANFE